MHLGVLQFTIQIPHAASLKDKRSVVRSMKDRLRRKYNISIAEIDDLDTCTLATLAIAIVGNDIPRLNGRLDKILNMLDEWRDATLDDHQIEIFSPK